MFAISGLSRLHPLTGLCLVLVLAGLFGGRTNAAAPPAWTEDLLPEHARLRLGSTRFRVQSKIGAFALSPDGRTLAATTRKAILLFDAFTGRRIRAFPRSDQSPAFGLLWVDGGRKLYLNVPGGMDVLDLSTRSFSHAPPEVAVISANGKRWASWGGGYDKADPAIVWDLATGKEAGRAVPAHCTVRWTVLSPDGKSLAMCSFPRDNLIRPLVPVWNMVKPRGVVQVWNVDTSKEKYRFELATENTWAACFSPDNKLLVVTASRGLLRMHDAATGKERWQKTSRAMAGPPGTVCFSADGKQVCTAGYQGLPALHDVATGREVSLKRPTLQNKDGAGFLANGQVLVWGVMGERLEVKNAHTGQVYSGPMVHLSAIRALTFTNDGKTLLALDEYGRLAPWDAQTGQVLDRKDARPFFLYRENRPLRKLAVFSADAKTLFVPLYNWAGDVHLVHSGTGRSLRILKGDRKKEDEWGNLAQSADGSTLAMFRYRWTPKSQRVEVVCSRWKSEGGKFGAVERSSVAAFEGMGMCRQATLPGCLGWDGTRAVVAVVRDHGPSAQFGIGFGMVEPAGTHLAGYDLTTRRTIATRKLNGFLARSLALAFNGRSTVLWGADGKLIVADLFAKDRFCQELAKIKGATAGPVFSPDGRTFAIANHEKEEATIRVFEWASRSERQRFSLGNVKVTSLAFSVDGALASGHQDSTILLWDLSGRSGSPAWKVKPTPAAVLWQRLLEANASTSNSAIQELIDRPEVTLDLVRKHRRLFQLSAPSAARVKELVEQLDAEEQSEREAATRELQRLHRFVEPQLWRALSAKPGLEVQQRLERLVSGLHQLTAEEVCHVRCVEVLERIGSPAARKVLQQWANGPAAATLTREATAALSRLAPG